MWTSALLVASVAVLIFILVLASMVCLLKVICE